MEFTDEEDIALLLVNVSEERRAEILKAFRNLGRRNELINQQRDILKQDIDAFKNELASMSVGRKKRVARSSTYEHTLNPALWSTLPLEIMPLVFARLPLYQIIRLRVLSQTWDRYVTGEIPGFTKVCAEINPKLFGMLCEKSESDNDDAGMSAVMLHDSGSKRSHRFTHVTPIDGRIETMRAGDGGLVCIVSLARDKKKHPLRIVVFNPLTRQERELPELPHALSSVHPSMVQLVMDRDSKCYKVIVVGPKKGRRGGVVARIYSSVTGQWRRIKASTDLIFGYHYNWDDEYSDDEDNWYVVSRGPCAYDCASGKLLDLEDESNPWKGPGESRYVLVKDRLFVLRKESYWTPRGYTNRYCISEYQAQRRQPHWVKLGVHRCSEFEVPSYRVEYHMHLYACNGFLLVTANNGERRGYQHDLAWLCDLCSGKWQAISGFPEEETEREDLAMFELQWDAVP